MNKLHIAVKLIQLLNERKSIDSKTVATELEVSLRTAQRYLLDLSNLPCVMCDEEKNRYYLAPDYHLKDSLLKVSELSLVSAVLDYTGNLLGEDHASSLATIKSKITRANEIYHFLQADSIDLESVEKARFPLEEAIRERKVVTFYYTRYEREYTVAPYRILYSNGFWYLVAGHDEQIKKFVLDFIENVSLSGAMYEEPPEDLRRTLAEARTVWFGSGDPVKVVVEFDAEVAHFFQRKRFFPKQEIVEEKENGNILVSMTMANEMDFFEQIARWLPWFRVVEPIEFRQFIAEQARTALEMNK